MAINAILVGDERIKAHLERLRPQIEDRLHKTVESLALKLMRAIKQDKLSGDPLHVRSGDLRRSITERVESDASGVHGIVGTNTEYARIQEFGGTIVPKNKQWLTIPLPAALTPAGVLKKAALEWENTFIRNGVIFQNQGKGNAPLALFVLKKSVTLPERSFLRSALREMRGEILSELKAALEGGMK